MLAADAGYADQAHLSREARELAGMTASELRLEWGQ
jgi:AraC-like DNA-binding protein